MARKRHHKWNRQRAPTTKDSLHSNSLEEDLRLQRLRQKESLEEKQRQATAQDVAVEDTDAATDDVAVEVLSPDTIASQLPQHLVTNGNATIWPGFPLELSFLHGFAILQQSPCLGPRKRTRLGTWMSSRYLLDNLHCHSRASLLYSKNIKWSDHILPGDMHCAWDMTCKQHLHASARTMDVASPVDQGVGILPNIATALQGGWGVYQPATGYRESRIHTTRCKPVYSIRLHGKSQRLGTVVRDDSSSTSYKFHFYSLPHATNYIEADLHTPVHDFCFGTDLAIFACPRFGGLGRNSILTPLFLRLDHPSGTLRSLNVQNFPQSDTLRVEMTCEEEKYVAFAHRNGQVSLLDLRQSSTNAAIIDSGFPGTERGSATDLKFLSNPKRLLVKRSFGPCELHDLRMLSPCPRSLVHTFGAHELAQPKFSFHKMLSANCNGLMVDPNTQHTLISPYVNSLHQPCLGFWNMVSGDMVGAKVLDDNPRQDTFFVELMSISTPSFDSRGRFVSSSFGAWMKCGRFSDEKIHSKTGSLHHLTFPGRYEYMQ